MALLFISSDERAAVWKPIFEAAGETIVFGEEAVSDPAEITHLFCWVPPKSLEIYPNLQVVISAGAGVDQMPAPPKGIVLSRSLDPGISEMVRDWVVMAALMLHRDMPRYLEQARAGEWRSHAPRLVRNTRIGIMGLGRIGRLAARTLSDLGFPVSGWSQSGRPVEGVEVFAQAELNSFLAGANVVVCLLPLTPATQGLMDAEFFAALPKGAALVHAGRGAQLDMNALYAALDSGHVATAMLDVTNPEPLPQDHWAWRHPRVVVTPHMAAETDHEQGALHALAVIRASRAKEPVPGLVDPDKGY